MNAEVSNNVAKATVMEANLTATVPRVIATEDNSKFGTRPSGKINNTVGIKNTVGINTAGVNTVVINNTVGINNTDGINTVGSNNTVGINLSREAAPEAKLTDSTTAEPLSAAAEVVVEAVEVTVAEATAAKATGAKVAAAEAATAENKCGGVQLADDLNVDEVQAIALSIVVSASDAVKAESSRGPQAAKGVEVNVVAEVDRATVATNKYKAEVTVETHFEAAAALDPADWKIDGVTKAIEAELKAEVLSVKAATGSTEVKLKTEADAIKAIEDNSVADKATATAAVVTTDAPEVKFKATSTDEPLLVNTAFADKGVAGAATEAASAETKFKGMPPADATGAGAEVTVAEVAGCVFNTVTAAQSVSCVENNATAITMVNTITQAEQHLSQVLVNIQFGDTPYGTPSTVGGNSTHSMRLNGTRSLVFAETVITVFKSWNAGSSGSISKYPVELQTSDVNADWEGWILVHSGQASDASVTTLDAPQQQPAVDGADDDTKGVSNLSVIAWQQKRARGLVIVRNDMRHQQLKQDLVIMTSPLRLQSQQASDTVDTTKVVSSLIGNSSVRAPVTARALSRTWFIYRLEPSHSASQLQLKATTRSTHVVKYLKVPAM